jgi:putrescine transport system substrate-binding protein
MDPVQLTEAEAVLKSVRPFIRYISSGKALNDLPNRDICIAMTWSGDYTQAQARADEVGADVRLAYSVPKEGTVLWFDTWLIPADAPHPGNAHLFLNFIMRPEIRRDQRIHRLCQRTLPRAFLAEESTRTRRPITPWKHGRVGGGLIYDPKLERRRTPLVRVKTGL